MKCNLSDICYFVNEKISLSELTKDTYISTENMLTNRGGITVASALPSITQTQAFKVGDVVVSNIRPYFKKIWHATFNGGCSNDVLVFRAKESIDSDFLYYVLADDAFFNYATGTSKGTKMPRGDKSAIMQYGVPNIALSLQTRIAHILKPIDNKISLNNAINHNLQQQAKVIFDEWFIKIPQSTQGTLKITPLGYFPDSFSVVKTGELPIVVADYVANGSFASLKENVKLYQSRNFAYFIRNTDLKSGSFEVFVDKHSYDFLSKSRLFGGEIIISNVGDVGSVFLCPTLDAPMTLGNNIIMIKSDIPELRLFLYIWFKWSHGQGLIQGIKSGSAQPKFNKTDFKNLPIILPPSELLQKFNSTVSPIFEMIERNDNENRKLSSLRDSILPKLMSGEIDVFEIEF